MNADTTLDLIASKLALALPTRLVTREALDFAQRSTVDMRRGVVTVIGRGITDLMGPAASQELQGCLKVMLIGELQLPEKATGLMVEKAEWALWEEIRAFIAAPGPGLCPLDALNRKPLASSCRKVAAQ